ncbi:MAG: SurA N-terminal domain-containing protein, partial [Mycobacteriales bacterium]
ARWRSPRRPATGAVLAVLAALVLTGCGDLRAGAAAVVGDQRVTDDQVGKLVDESLAAPGAREGLATNFHGDLASYKRTLLRVEVRRLLAEASAARLGIAVPESEVEARYRSMQQQAGSAAAFAAQLAAQPISPALYRELVRTEVIESEIGYRQGGVRRLTESQLRAAYEQYLPTATTANLTLIQLPDAATARRVLAQVQADPAQFGPVGAQFSQQRTPPKPQDLALNTLPADLARRLQQTEPGTIFGYQLSNGGAQAFFVIRFGGIKRPTLQSARPQLVAQSVREAALAGQKYVARVAGELGVEVNPRYGTWTTDNLTITEFVNPVIKPTPRPTGGTPGEGGPAGPSPAPSPSG